MPEAAFRVAVSEQPLCLQRAARGLDGLQAEKGLEAGAIVSFVGKVRNDRHPQSGAALRELVLEQYPAMTRAALADIARQACERWPGSVCLVVHRFGPLSPGDPIVYVGTASAHRQDAFASCEFLMDFLKTSVPFWKKQRWEDGCEAWVQARSSDEHRASRWDQSGEGTG